MSPFVTNKPNNYINPNLSKQAGSDSVKANQNSSSANVIKPAEPPLKSKSATRVGLGVAGAANFNNPAALSPTFAAPSIGQANYAKPTGETFAADNVTYLLNDILSSANNQSILDNQSVLNIINKKMPAVMQKAYKKKLSASGTKASTSELLDELNEACNYLVANTGSTAIEQNSLNYITSVIEFMAGMLNQLNGQVKAEAGTSTAISSLLTANSNLNAVTANAISVAAQAERAQMIAQLKAQLTAAMDKLNTEIKSMKKENRLHLIIGDLIGALLIYAGAACIAAGAASIGVGLIISGAVQIGTTSGPGAYENHELNTLQDKVNTLQQQINNVASCDDTQALTSFQNSMNDAINEFAAKMKISNDVGASVQIVSAVLMAAVTLGVSAGLSTAQICIAVFVVILPNIAITLATSVQTFDNNTHVQKTAGNVESWLSLGGMLGHAIDAIHTKENSDQEEAKLIIAMVTGILVNLAVAFIAGRFMAASSAKTGSINVNAANQGSITIPDQAVDEPTAKVANGVDDAANGFELQEPQSTNNTSIAEQNSSTMNNIKEEGEEGAQTQSGLRKALTTVNKNLADVKAKASGIKDSFNDFYRDSMVDKALTALQKSLGPHYTPGMFAPALNFLTNLVTVSSSQVSLDYQQLDTFYTEMNNITQAYLQLIAAENKGDTNTNNAINQMLENMLEASNKFINSLQQTSGDLAQADVKGITETLQIEQKLAAAIN